MGSQCGFWQGNGCTEYLQGATEHDDVLCVDEGDVCSPPWTNSETFVRSCSAGRRMCTVDTVWELHLNDVELNAVVIVRLCPDEVCAG
eukprot:gene21103-65960_t